MDPVPTEVRANGKLVGVRLPCTVAQFLEQLGMPPKSVVVEHNGEALSPSHFSQRSLSEGDRLEIVRVVAGG